MSDLKSKKVFIFENSGCIRRKLDAKKLSEYLLKNGYELADKPYESDIIIFIGCGVVNEFAEASLRLVKKFQKYDAELIVAGCIPEIEKEKLQEIFKGKKISTKDLDKIDELFPDNKIKFSSINDANCYHHPNYFFEPLIKDIYSLFGKISSFKRKYYSYGQSYKLIIDKKDTFIIRIGWGCFNNCAYCATKKAVGPLISKPLEECINEFKKGLNGGYKYFILTADDTGAYGIDNGSNFQILLDELTKISGDYEILVVNLNPSWVVRYIGDLELLPEEQKKKITHFEIPIQSGSQNVLKLMNRFYDAEKMKDALLRLKKSFPNAIIETDVMIGFPKESNEDFIDTLKLLKEIKFHTGLFMGFDSRPETIAYSINPKIDRKEIINRFEYACKFLKKEGFRVKYRYIAKYIPYKELSLDFGYNCKNK